MKRISSHLARLAVETLVGLVVLSCLSACASLNRSGASGYAGRDDHADFGRDHRAQERDATSSELAAGGARDYDDADTVSLRIALKKAERALEGKREREQYFKNKPYLRNDRDRLELLSLDSFESRAKWLNARGVNASVTSFAPEIQALIDINDISLGMTKQAVRESWGEPELVEVSGNPMYGNERWHFSEQTSSTEGYRTQHRLVYFEGGRVAGWESR